MRTVVDARGNTWQVGSVLLGEKARAAQIYPGNGQISLSTVGHGGNTFGLCLPEYQIRAWLAGEIQIAIGESK